jgi:hypothetical protein
MPPPDKRRLSLRACGVRYRTPRKRRPSLRLSGVSAERKGPYKIFRRTRGAGRTRKATVYPY